MKKRNNRKQSFQSKKQLMETNRLLEKKYYDLDLLHSSRMFAQQHTRTDYSIEKISVRYPFKEYWELEAYYNEKGIKTFYHNAINNEILTYLIENKCVDFRIVQDGRYGSIEANMRIVKPK